MLWPILKSNYNAQQNLQCFINNEECFYFQQNINLTLQSKNCLFAARPSSNFLLSNVDFDKQHFCLTVRK